MKSCRNVVVFSDCHAGCRLGLCPPNPPKLDEGTPYEPSRAQDVVWAWWRKFWDEWVPAATKGEPYLVVCNGDALDGVHHGATSQISQNLTDQRRIAIAALAPEIRKGIRYYHIRGTEAHAGKSAADEEALAEQLEATPDADGRYARWELWLRMGRHLIHFLHHIGTTSSSAHETSAINAELTAEFVEACRWGEQPPSVIVRSHRHRSAEVRLPTHDGYATAVVTPAWQLKTSHAYKIAGARLAPPQIGGVLIRLDSDGNPYTQTFVRHIGRSPAARV